jgi:hypothetical protein
VRLARATPASQARSQVPGHDLPFGAHLVAVRMVDLVVDAQRGRPGLLGGGRVTRTELDITEMVQRVGLVEAVGELAVEADGLLVARDRLLVVAELMVDVAEVAASQLRSPSCWIASSACSQ